MDEKIKLLKKLFYKNLKERGWYVAYRNAMHKSERNVTEKYIFLRGRSIIDRSLWWDDTDEGYTFWQSKNDIMNELIGYDLTVAKKPHFF